MEMSQRALHRLGSKRSGGTVAKALGGAMQPESFERTETHRKKLQRSRTCENSKEARGLES